MKTKTKKKGVEQKVPMSLAKVKQRALRLEENTKRDVRTKFAALCWRHHKKETQVLLVTTRRTRRWILPKGWPVDMATPVEAAQAEAWEEAGVKGKAKPICVDIYSSTKDLPDDTTLPIVVAVFPMEIKTIADDWPEKKERKRKWFSLSKAASVVQEPELASILKYFEPKLL